MRRTLLALAIATLMAGMPAGAHHSFAADYFEDQSISIEGEVQEFEYRSPHAIQLITARTPEGQTRTYAAEWSNPLRLGRRGINAGTLKPGDFVVVTGSPGRAGFLVGISAPVQTVLSSARRTASVSAVRVQLRS